MASPVEVCEPWITPDRLCCPDAPAVVPCADPEAEPQAPTYLWSDEELIDAASHVLYRATCRQFPGECTRTIRPCPPCTCGRTPCGCSGRYYFITLSERLPVVSVEQVTVDGTILLPADYRVDDHARLVRVSGEPWPVRQDLELPITEPGTFSVTFTAGRRPPIELQMAAAELACEMKRACGGLDCSLPRNVTSVSRQGVTMNIDALEAAVGAAATGLAMVDNVVGQYDCRRARSRVWHPSLGRSRGVGIG